MNRMVLITLLIGGDLLASLACARAIEPIAVVANEGIAAARQPQATLDATGRVFVTFGSGDAVYCVRSDDGGRSYQSAVKVGEINKLALGMRRGPRISATQDAVVISAIGHEAGNLLTWRSKDAGKSWQQGPQVNDSVGNAREGLHAMAQSAEGALFCVWLDCRDQERGSRLFGAASSDGGQTWSKNRLVYASPSGSICECCHPSLTYDQQGGLHVMWRNSLAGKRDLYTARSADGGQTFAMARRLGEESWPLEGCPMDGGAIAVDQAGQLVSIWRRRTQIFCTDGNRAAERLLGEGQQPWLTATSSGIWSVWINHRRGDLYLLRPGNHEPIKVAAAATDPMITAAIAGKGPVIAVWEAQTKHTTAIMSAVIEP